MKETLRQVLPVDQSQHYIIGIGASAGGLEAIHDLFDNMPGDTGYSFVVIQHLSPDHKSLMAELLTHHTTMPVLEAEDGMEVLPNTIYVIPSKMLMTIRDHRLFLAEQLKGIRPSYAIDIFLKSLAEACGQQAVAIVLSGTGTDGSKGIEEIKQRGGMVVVQDPQSASFDGMPNSAMATGHADLILPPEAMAQELVDFIAEQPEVRTVDLAQEHHEEKFRDILEIILRTTRHDFSAYKHPTLLRRLARRMVEVGTRTLDEYIQCLHQTPEEVHRLDRDFLIHVTRFFRDADAFDFLAREVIPKIFAQKETHDGIKIWVAACSSGEEAYNMAILLSEHQERHKLAHIPIKIFATDIDQSALEVASRGVYAHTIAADVSADRLQRFFIREGELYRVSPEIRKMVVFASHDLLRDPPFSRLDLISCRNMFIYLNPIMQRKVLRRFHFSLNLNGFLMLGPSENIGELKAAMVEMNRKWKVYRCITKSTGMEHDNLMVPVHHRTITAEAATARPINKHLSDIFRETLTTERCMAGIFIDQDMLVKHAIGQFKSFLNFPDDNFHFNLLKLVAPELGVALGICIRKALSTHERVAMRHVVVMKAGRKQLVDIIVNPYVRQQTYHQAFLCVVLEEVRHGIREHNVIIADTATTEYDRVAELERELVDTRENLIRVVEEMETANEELQASNEELISTNEELQSTNEELQSLNEELHTLSVEHQLKIRELLELNDDLNNYFNNSDIGQILVGADLSIRKFSPSVTRIMNLIESDQGRSLSHITHRMQEPHFVEDVTQVIATGKPIEKTVTLSGNRYFLLRINPFLRRHQIPDGAVVSFVDVSEYKRLSSIIEAVFNSSINPILALRAVYDEADHVIDLAFLTINEAAETLLGQPRAAMMGKRLLHLFPDPITQSNVMIYKQVIETGEIGQFEFLREENKRWYHVVAVRMLEGVVVTYRDITEQKNAEAIVAQSYERLKVASQKLMETNMQLERSNFDLLQFASVASHDLKEPLRKIQAFGNILQSKIHDKLNESELGYLHKIISASSRMQTLIEDVLTLSKLSNQGSPHERTDLNKIIQRICDDLEISIREKHAVVEVGELPEVVAVPGQMRQLFQNLISNALKFNDKPACRISIRTQPVSAEVQQQLNLDLHAFACIALCDNGVGFESEYNEKIFGIFQRLHGRNYEGTGIGLAIARKIVENHHGYIFASGALHEGACFTLYLPLATR